MAYKNIPIKKKTIKEVHSPHSDAYLRRLRNTDAKRRAGQLKPALMPADALQRIQKAKQLLRPIVEADNYSDLFDGQPIEVALQALEDAEEGLTYGNLL